MPVTLAKTSSKHYFQNFAVAALSLCGPPSVGRRLRKQKKNKKIAGVHEELQNTQAFFLKLCSQEYKVLEAKRRASKGEYETTANLLHSTYEQF